MSRRPSPVRISGLVRLSNQVNNQLVEGIPQRQLKHFREIVVGAVTRVEEICAKAGCTPDHLPAPSRRAYHFLKGIDLDAVQAREPVKTRRSTVKIRNIVSNHSYLQKRINDLALAKGPVAAYDELLPLVGTWREQIDGFLAEAGQGPGSMNVRSRRAYALIRFLSEPERLKEHVDSVYLFLSLIHQLDFVPREVPPVVEMAWVNHLYSYKRDARQSRYQLCEPFVGADETVMAAILKCIHRRKGGNAKQVVDEYQASEAFQSISAEFDLLCEVSDGQPEGRVFDLRDIFDTVNREHFGGEMPSPRLRWGTRMTFRKFGHYCFQKEEVMLSASLDSPRVPRFVVEFVMYHELLHRKHGHRSAGSRRMYHTREFRTDEKRFPRFTEAEAELAKLTQPRRRTLF